MARNKVQFQRGLSEAEFDELYGTEERCHAELARLRWPEGFECPDCGVQGHCVVKRGARLLFQCNACRKQTSVKAGTIFASSKLPLRLWFKAMYLVTQSKKGISSIELGRRLGVTQTTAWTMKHKLAQVMIERNGAKRLNGNVQMDDAYIGGERSGKHGRGAAGKTPFVAAVATTEDGKPDQIILRRVIGFRKVAIGKLTSTALTGGANVITDALALFHRRHNGWMHAHSNSNWQRRAGRQKAGLQMGQHRPWKHQVGFGRNLQGRALKTRAAISRRVRISVQPQIPPRNNDPASRIRRSEDRAYAIFTPKAG